MGSLQTHRQPPDTFDGEIAEYAFGKADPAKRLLIGGRYPIACADGIERMGTLTCTTVSEEESVVIGGVSFDDGSATVCDFPLSAAEVDAWRRHPDTFFGTPDRGRETLVFWISTISFLIVTVKHLVSSCFRYSPMHQTSLHCARFRSLNWPVLTQSG